MKIKPFLTEHFFAKYEFTASHLLASSDCETTSIAELLELSGGSLAGLGALKLGYTESQGHPDYRRMVAEMYEGVAADDVVILTSPVEGIYLTMQTLLDASDEVIALSPAYDALHHVADHLCGEFRPWQTACNSPGVSTRRSSATQTLNVPVHAKTKTTTTGKKTSITRT